MVRDGATEWDGVRNHAAAGHLRAMAVGDCALIYHSGPTKAAAGVAEITRAAKPDSEAAHKGAWVSVALAPVEPLPQPVTLAAMKALPALEGMAMLRQPRLSVSPVSEVERAAVLRLTS